MTQPLELTWPGGAHPFRLRIGELRALQEATGAGPEELFNGLRTGRWRVDHLVQVLRWGLVGGGSKTASEAATLVTPLIDLHPLVEFKLAALAVLGHALLGADPEDAVGEPAGPAETGPKK
jgi:hypothetical protein